MCVCVCVCPCVCVCVCDLTCIIHSASSMTLKYPSPERPKKDSTAEVPVLTKHSGLSVPLSLIDSKSQPNTVLGDCSASKHQD